MVNKSVYLLYNCFYYIFSVCHSVKITNLKVPSTYILEQTTKTPAALILDCEYLIRQDETGFVLKWLLDDSPIYQWIPSHKPYASVGLLTKN